MSVKSLQSCPTLCDPKDCSLPGSSVQGTLQARTLERVAMPSSREGISPTKGPNMHLLQLLFCRQILYCWATRGASVPSTLVCFRGKQYNKTKFWVQGGFLLFGKSWIFGLFIRLCKRSAPNPTIGDRVFPHICKQAILRPLVGVLHFNSFLTLSTQRQHQIPQDKGSALQNCPQYIHSNATCKPRLSSLLLTELLHI